MCYFSQCMRVRIENVFFQPVYVLTRCVCMIDHRPNAETNCQQHIQATPTPQSIQLESNTTQHVSGERLWMVRPSRVREVARVLAPTHTKDRHQHHSLDICIHVNLRMRNLLVRILGIKNVKIKPRTPPSYVNAAGFSPLSPSQPYPLLPPTECARSSRLTRRLLTTSGKLLDLPKGGV